MLKHAANLSDSYEYYLIWAGGTAGRPWGSKEEAYNLFPELRLRGDGLALAGDFSGGGHDAAATTSVALAVSDEGITLGLDVLANEYAGATLRMGSNTAGSVGYGVVQSNTASDVSGAFTAQVTWTIGLTSGTGGASADCYFVRESRKWSTYPQVRVLTPYQPVGTSATEWDVRPTTSVSFANGGRSITLPAPYSGSTGATSFDDVGVLLPASLYEGIDGYGISDVGDSAASGQTHEITDITGSVWTFANAIAASNMLAGGYLLVDWETSGVVMKRSWAPITSSTGSTFTVGTWLGDGDPADYTTIMRYTAWVPHYNDSPYAYLPGEGYSYPNHDMLPCGQSSIGAQIHCRPRTVTGSAYGDTFGAMLVAAMRLSAATGKRVNVVNLAATDASLLPSRRPAAYGFGGKLGWYDQDEHTTWSPSSSTSLYARMDKLLRTVLPNAMTAEGNTKGLRCLGVVFAQGGVDAVSAQARASYGAALKQFVDVTRRLVNTLGHNPYANGAEIPFVQPRVPYLPYGVDGTYARASGRGGGTAVYDADDAGFVNAAIEEATSTDEFAAAVHVDDLPRLSTDLGIYSGEGEVALGDRVGGQLSILADHGLSFGSAALAAAQTRVVEICNLALAHIGDAGQVTSLSDGSEQAVLCQRFLPEARDELLQVRQWGFALRRRALVPVRKAEPMLYRNWEYCYVIPGEALFSFKILPPSSELTSADFDYTTVTTSGYAATFVANGGSGTVSDSPSPVAAGGGTSGVFVDPGNLLPVLTDTEQAEQAFKVEQGPTGHRYIYTNQQGATLQYVARVADADLYPPLFASALAANLGSKLASVIIKGDEGEKVSTRLMQKVGGYLSTAASRDATEQRPVRQQMPFEFVPDHIRHRT